MLCTPIHFYETLSTDMRSEVIHCGLSVKSVSYCSASKVVLACNIGILSFG